METVWRTESSPGSSRRPDFTPGSDSHLKPYQSVSCSILQLFETFGNRFETAWKPFGGQNPAQEAPGGQTSPLEAGSHLKPYQSVVRFCNCLNRLETVLKPLGNQNPAQETPGGQTSPLEVSGAQENAEEPRRVQEDPGEPRRAQETPGEPRRPTGKLRRAQESPGEPRRARESAGESRRTRRVQEDLGERRTARAFRGDVLAA